MLGAPIAGRPPAVRPGPDGPDNNGPFTGSVERIRVARSELRRQLREQKRARTTALIIIVAVVLVAPALYFGVLAATRDPVLNSLDRLPVAANFAEQPEDRIISGSRWCLIDCRFRERRLVSQAETEETTAAYQAALVEAGWSRWDVQGCPQVEVDGDYSCWIRDEYTLDLWVHPPECAYDPLNLRPNLDDEDEPEAPEEPAEPTGDDDCRGSVVEIKMQNRIADERGGAAVPAPDDAPTSEDDPSDEDGGETEPEGDSDGGADGDGGDDAGPPDGGPSAEPSP